MQFPYFETCNSCLYYNVITITCCLLSCPSFKLTEEKKPGKIVTDVFVGSISHFLLTSRGTSKIADIQCECKLNHMISFQR
jgi:hypothetical protein